jgi:Arc/MetJ-type ribon-helix-helix transcriptional regulator
MASENISFRIDESLNKKIEKEVENGDYDSRSEYIREVLRNNEFAEDIKDDMVTNEKYEEAVAERDRLRNRVNELEQKHQDIDETASRAAMHMYKRINDSNAEIVDDFNGALSELRMARNTVVGVDDDLDRMERKIDEIDTKISILGRIDENVKHIDATFDEIGENYRQMLIEQRENEPLTSRISSEMNRRFERFFTKYF